MTPAVFPSGLRVAGLLLSLLAASGAAAECIDYANHLHWLGGYDNGNYINDVAVSGNYACIAETAEFGASARFRLVDVSDPQAPQPRSLLELGNLSSEGIAVTGSIAYVATVPFNITRIVDFSNPASPVVVGSFNGGNDVCIDGNRAYTIGGSLKVWNITDPRHPTLLGSAQVVGETVAVSGNHAYVGDDEFGLRIVDVSNPAAPLAVGTLPLPEGAYQVAVAGSFAFVASWNDGLIVVNVSDPAQPVIAGSVGGFQAYGVAVEGTTAFAGSLRAIDISNPAEPVVIGRAPTSLGRVTLADSKAYVASTNPVSGLAIVDIRAPTGAASLGNLAMTPPPHAVAAGDGLALLLDDLGLKLVDVSGPTPTLAGEVALPNGRDIAALGDYAIVAAGASGLQVVDVHNPPQAAIVASLDTPDLANDVALDGNIVYLADVSGGLRIIDLSNPLAPVLLRAVLIHPSQVAVSDGLAYAYDNSGVLKIFDVSNPTTPIQLGSLPVPQGADLAARGQHAFVLTLSGLVVVDATDPMQPITVATLEMPAGGGSIALGEGAAYIAGSINVSRSYVQVVDISDPEFPWHRGGAYEFQNPYDVAVGSNGLLLATEFGLYRYPAQCPLTTAIPGAPAASRASQFLYLAPNPMRSLLDLRFTLNEPGAVTLEVFDVHGRKLRRLLEAPLGSGEHQVTWDGRGDRGEPAASGVYWVRLDGPGLDLTRPVTILR